MIKKLALALAVSSFIAAPVMAKSDAATCSLDKGRVSVLGYGQVEALPDLVELNFTVNKTDNDAAKAKSAVTDVVSAFVSSLEKLNIEKDEIYAASVSVYPKYSYNKTAEKKFEGYEAIRNVTVSLSDFSLISKITDAAMNSGINGITGFVYKIKDTKALQLKADEIAINDAKDKASRLAKGFGVSLGKPCSLSFGDNRDVRPLMMSRAAALSDNDAAGSIPEYLQKKISVESTVSAEFSLAKNQKK